MQYSPEEISEMRKLAGLPVLENYIYADESPEMTDETEEMMDEIDAENCSVILRDPLSGELSVLARTIGDQTMIIGLQTINY